MGQQSPEPKIEDRPEGSRDEDILWLRNELGWSFRSISQALSVAASTACDVVKKHASSERAAS